MSSSLDLSTIPHKRNRNVKGVAWFKNDIVVKDSLPGESEMAQGARMEEPAGASNRAPETHRQSFQRQSFSSGQQSGWQRGALNVYDPAANISARPSQSIEGNATSRSSSSSQEIATEPAGSDNSQINSSAQSANVQSSGNQASGKITLRGSVSSEEQKKMIENQLRSIQGVNDVENELEVQK
jgi:osmotically-inducible protein OsmY